jgi:hypothetical protein
MALSNFENKINQLESIITNLESQIPNNEKDIHSRLSIYYQNVIELENEFRILHTSTINNIKNLNSRIITLIKNNDISRNRKKWSTDSDSINDVIKKIHENFTIKKTMKNIVRYDSSNKTQKNQ